VPQKLLETDDQLLACLRRCHSATVGELVEALGVTATAVRQRLTRMMDADYVQRSVERQGRGRPVHRYKLTESGAKASGNNYADLAISLWQEIRAVPDPDFRRGLLKRIARRLTDQYAGQVRGETTDERMESLASLMNDREVLFDVNRSHQLPVLTARACPYPDLAEQDRSICAMERLLFSEVLGEPLKLSECRLDGGNCCTFEMSTAYE
jgi:DeoR family transcriptional regulator, suf operon transcriptional repressor